ncbi:ATP-binding protein [Streptomyces profundus]|uniref:ATP-binding protein n=1 Tax=Streptomyces profundus TaxID=2867410 RepID=UPI001D16B32F|nr:ATP-binding protein [Streptomyces sp. MA3_2.13]UED84166.1 ATP-binding protein [Streptomyces sp. MA3_2.13]
MDGVGDGDGARRGGGAFPGGTHNHFDGMARNVIQANRIDTVELRGPARAPTPYELPVVRPGFVNRSSELAWLDAEWARWAGGADGLTLVVLPGAGGMGKTELAAHWGDRSRERFPDGQLHVDLAAERQGGGGVDLGAVLARFARSLGVDASFIGPTPAERAAIYRSATTGRRGLLLLIDNAEHASEVRALLPRHGMVLVTSRRPLPALRMDGARELVVGELGAAAGRALVASWWEDGEVDTATLDELVRLCGGRPLALRAVGERLLAGPDDDLPRVVAELAAERDGRHRRAVTGDGGDTRMTDALRLVHDGFPPATRRLCRLLGALPGPTFTVELALATGADEPAAGLAELLRAGLVRELAPGHYAFHDEARALVSTLAMRGADRESALRGAVAFALAVCELVDRAVLGNRLRLAGGEGWDGPPALPELAGPAAALDWLEREHGTVLALLRAAAERGWHEPVWRMCQALWAFYHSRKRYAGWIDSHQLGITAAGWAGRPDAELRIRNQLARAYLESRDFTAAQTALTPAEALLERVGSAQLRGVIEETRGLLALASGRAADAVAHLTEAKAANAGDPRGEAMQGYQLARALLALGRPRDALAELATAEALVPGPAHAALHARIGLTRGTALLDSGEPERARTVLTEAARLAESLGQWAKADGALTILEHLAQQAGDTATAHQLTTHRTHLRQRAGLPPTDED